MVTIEHIWAKIRQHQGEDFFQIKGKKFTYEVIGNAVVPSTTKWNIPKGDFEKALKEVPLKNTVSLQYLQGPSYIFAILTDERIVTHEVYAKAH